MTLSLLQNTDNRPGAQGDGGLDSARAAPAGEGGLAGVSECEGSGISGEGAELRCRGDRAFHSSKPLEAAAVAELHVALALRGWESNKSKHVHSQMISEQALCIFKVCFQYFGK